MKPSQTGERLVTVATGGAAPTDGVTAPQFVLSPYLGNGSPTTGFSFCLAQPSAGGATAAGSGFTIQPYRLIPTLGIWASLASYADAAYSQQLVCYDVGAGAALYFVISNASVAGNVIICVGELP